MKKIILAFIIFNFIISTAFANNFYLGAGGGYEPAVFNKKILIEGADFHYHYYKEDRTGGDGFFGTVFGGYAWTPNRYYLAWEANANLSSLKYTGWFKETPNNSSNNDFTIRKSYGISLLPGYKFFDDKLLVYARVGLTRGEFGYKEYKTSPDMPAVYGLDDHQWINGVRYGLGVEAELKNNWSWRLEYNHINYQTYMDTSFPLPNTRLRKIDLTPETNQIELSLIYRF